VPARGSVADLLARAPRRQRRADAFAEIVAGWLATGKAPLAGGARPQLVVTADLGDLIAGRGLGHTRPDPWTGAGTELGIGDVLRIGCDSGLTLIAGHHRPLPDDLATALAATKGPVDAHDHGDAGPSPDRQSTPVVDEAALRAALAGIAPALGGLQFEPLALGRTARLVSPAQRTALNARDRGCTHPGCDAPPERCEVHHTHHWARGGSTNLDQLRLYCKTHHRWAHHRDNDHHHHQHQHQHQGEGGPRPPPPEDSSS
jgi:hypothetical protein